MLLEDARYQNIFDRRTLASSVAQLLQRRIARLTGCRVTVR